MIINGGFRPDRNRIFTVDFAESLIRVSFYFLLWRANRDGAFSIGKRRITDSHRALSGFTRCAQSNAVFTRLCIKTDSCRLMCSGYTILADRQGSTADGLRVIEGRTRRVHVDEFQSDLDIGAVLFQFDASAGFKRDCAAAYFCTVSFCSGFMLRFGIITAFNG